ncbi:MAG TPA: histidine kinase, partial [Epulopiscium sp.]|nr:histidine kinase [Candidatus Epulonipiscium sp.]
MKKITLTQKVILIFLIVIIPITILLSLSTDRSKNVIREEVSKSNSNLLTIYMNKIDEDLESIETYLYKMISSHSHIYTDDYKAKNYSDYILSLLSFKKQLLDDSYLYPFVDLFFIYDAESNEIIETSNILNNDLTGGNTLKDLVIDKGPIPWTVIYKADSWLLIKMMNINQTLYLGSCFRINKIMPEDMTFSEGALVGIMDDNGMLLAGDKSIREVLLSKNKKDNSEDFDVAHDEDLTAFLLTTAASQDSPLTLMLAYPEEGMLRALHEIQRMQYLAPVLIILTLLLYIYLLKTTLIKPINIIEKSMKSIGAGKWETRIEEDWSEEFLNIAEGFNEMVDHIHSLKIAMYDEKIKVQKAEYRYLQMQINPHFYMNTLNVIYNMAALKDYEQVQKLSIYLSNHFRYIMKSSQKLTILNDEIEHTKNYLEIHKVR